MSADHIPDASPAVTDVGKLIQAPLVGRLVDKDDLRLLLSERAELLATVERMRGRLERLASSEAFDLPQAIDGPLAQELRMRLDYARAALTTGEATTPNAGERG